MDPLPAYEGLRYLLLGVPGKEVVVLLLELLGTLLQEGLDTHPLGVQGNLRRADQRVPLREDLGTLLQVGLRGLFLGESARYDRPSLNTTESHVCGRRGSLTTCDLCGTRRFVECGRSCPGDSVAPRTSVERSSRPTG